MAGKDCITEVFDKARVIDFDQSSKFILFSDCHRGDDSWADDFARNGKIYFHALTHYYNENFTYIEIGDGDDLWENNDFEDIRSAHSDVFWLLCKFYQDNRFILIWGNHNINFKDPKYVEKHLFRYFDERDSSIKPLFNNIIVNEGVILRDRMTKDKIFLFHGHQGEFFCDKAWPLTRFFVRYIWKPLRIIGVNDPTSPAKNYQKRIQCEERIIDWIKEKKEIVVCGHTHRSFFPNPEELPYFNTGSCVHPRCITGIEIEKNEMTLVKWWITPDDEGILRVKRVVLEGPKSITSFIKNSKKGE